MRRTRRAAIAAWLVATMVAAPGAWADELTEWAEELTAGNIEDWSLEELLGRVVAVSRRAESALSAPATVAVVTREDVRLSGARDIPDLLRGVPGVQVYQRSPGAYTVSIRGMGGLQDNNVVVLLDGQAVNSELDGSVDWAGLPVHLGEIERIEVVRGPVSTIYGADAYAGVIAITTVAPQDAARSTASAMLGTDERGTPQGELAASVSGAVGQLTWRAGAHGLVDQRSPDVLGAMTLPGRRKLAGNLALEYELPDRWVARARLAAAMSEHDGQDHQTAVPARLSQPHLQASATIETRERPGVLSDVALWAVAHHSRVRRLDDGSSFSKDGTVVMSARTGVELAIEPVGGALLRAGGEAGVDHVDAPFLDEDARARARGSYAGYAVGEWKPGERLRLSAGLRLDRGALMGTELSYRAAATYSDGRRFGGRLSIGSGFRRPTYLEVIGRVMDPLLGVVVIDGERGLEPQRITAMELGFTFAPDRRVTLQPVVYAARLDHVISEDFDPLVRKTFVNIAADDGLVTVVGAELDVRYRYSDALQPRAAASALWWPSDGYAGTAATVGNPAQNSNLTGTLGVVGVAREGLLAYGAQAVLTSPREYDVRTGIPPVTVRQQVPVRAHLSGSVEYQVLQRSPVWCWLKVRSDLPAGGVEAPFPAASELGTVVVAGVEYRGR